VGAETILKRNKYTLAEEFEDKLLNQANLLYVKDHFAVDCGVSDLDGIITSFAYSTYNSCGCELTEYIHDQIAFKRKLLKRPSICETLKDSHKKCNKIIKECCEFTSQPQFQW